MRSVVATIVLLVVEVAAAQSPSSAFDGITRLSCALNTAASVRWVEGRPHVDVRRGLVFKFELDDIDPTGGTARFIFGAVAVTVIALPAGSTLTFIDRRLDGSMAMTTVLAESGRTRRLRAAYSRTEYYAYDGPGFASVPEAEQYYGYCDASVR